VGYWGLPVVILCLIFQEIDLHKFASNMLHTNIPLMLAGIACMPIAIILAALRWNLLVRRYVHSDIGFQYSVKHYWMGVPIGIFVPGSLGLDAYRVMVIGRRCGSYIRNIAVILAEKLMALVACLSLILLLYPFVPFSTSSPVARHILSTAYVLLFGIIVLFVCIFLVRRSTGLKAFVEGVERWISIVIHAVVRKLWRSYAGRRRDLPWRDLLYPLAAPKHLLPIVGLSIAIQILAAIGHQICFAAIGYDVPILVNVFVSPIIFFVFALPISFGGLGVREAAFITLYGAFGVSAEIALLVSFYGFVGLLLDNAIGALMIWFNKEGARIEQLDGR